MRSTRDRSRDNALRMPLMQGGGGGSSLDHNAGGHLTGSAAPSTSGTSQPNTSSMRSRTSPIPTDRISAGSARGPPPMMSRPKNPTSIAPGQPAPGARQRDKFVPLPDEDDSLDGPMGGPGGKRRGVAGLLQPKDLHRTGSCVFVTWMGSCCCSYNPWHPVGSGCRGLAGGGPNLRCEDTWWFPLSRDSNPHPSDPHYTQGAPRRSPCTPPHLLGWARKAPVWTREGWPGRLLQVEVGHECSVPGRRWVGAV